MGSPKATTNMNLSTIASLVLLAAVGTVAYDSEDSVVPYEDFAQDASEVIPEDSSVAQTDLIEESPAKEADKAAKGKYKEEKKKPAKDEKAVVAKPKAKKEEEEKKKPVEKKRLHSSVAQTD